MLVEKTVVEFIDEMGSDSPAPGGGSAAALAGALAGALTAMVGRLTVKNGQYACVHNAAREIITQAASATERLTAFIDEDTRAFNAVMAAFKMPKATDEEKRVRSEAIQEATQGATLLPLKVAEHCLEILEMARKILLIGNTNAASDAAVSGLMAYAGLQGALYNVKINLPGIKDTAFVECVKQRMAAVTEQAGKQIKELEANAQKTMPH